MIYIRVEYIRNGSLLTLAVDFRTSVLPVLGTARLGFASYRRGTKCFLAASEGYVVSLNKHVSTMSYLVAKAKSGN